ncbi:MAG: NADH-quinone oxidoreductase subunit L [Verrucomicrobia bacterium]|nr:NADH-quinone oxidoreductase subunit L [Verrucomicrobiota bacterium]
MIAYAPYLILLLPLFSAVLIRLVLHPFPRIAVPVSVAACLGSFLGSLVLLNGGTPSGGMAAPAVTWIELGGLKAGFALMADPLARLMATLVTGVALLVHIYSLGYMAKDPCRSRFFAELSLFVFSMLGIVFADNLVSMFIFWELVGLSSYLLIGFWHSRPAAGAAANKAFLVNRIGDFGFLLGILGAWSIFGTISFADLSGRVATEAPFWAVTATGLGLLCGCLGKSAQLPLHVWLPDSMEGPTPVSSLLHAATMVVAGVYMLIRVLPILELSALTMNTIAWIGALMTLLPALVACQQNDIKRILAYSTLSEIAYMVMAIGLGIPGPGMYHLVTHAFFKCLLFLAAGSVIHGCHGEQDIWKMGGLRQRMPFTFLVTWVGTLALAAIPPVSGFWSKDAIFAATHDRPGLAACSMLAGFFTSFFMLRMILVAFEGKPRSENARHAHEGPPVMVVPMLILAVFAVFGGMLPVAEFLGMKPEQSHHAWTLWLSLILAAAGFLPAYFLYRDAPKDPLQVPLLQGKFYVDEFYQRVLVATQDGLGRLADAFEGWVVRGLLVRGSGVVARSAGQGLRLIQCGQVQFYAAVFILGTLGLVAWLLWKGAA